MTDSFLAFFKNNNMFEHINKYVQPEPGRKFRLQLLVKQQLNRVKVENWVKNGDIFPGDSTQTFSRNITCNTLQKAMGHLVNEVCRSEKSTHVQLYKKINIETEKPVVCPEPVYSNCFTPSLAIKR